MAELIPGYQTEQLIITVLNNDTDMNTALTTQAASGWIVSLLTLSGSNVIMLFTRTVIAT